MNCNRGSMRHIFPLIKFAFKSKWEQNLTLFWTLKFMWSFIVVRELQASKIYSFECTVWSQTRNLTSIHKTLVSLLAVIRVSTVSFYLSYAGELLFQQMLSIPKQNFGKNDSFWKQEMWMNVFSWKDITPSLKRNARMKKYGSILWQAALGCS